MSAGTERVFQHTSLENLDQVIYAIQELQPGAGIITLSGDLGTGKTTLVKALLKKLGCSDPVSSPTFSILNEYSTHDLTIYHTDWYRIENIAELYEAGMEEYVDRPDALLIVEWPAVGLSLLPPARLEIKITHDGISRNYELKLS